MEEGDLTRTVPVSENEEADKVYKIEGELVSKEEYTL